ncbi:MAG: TadE/TadG family type IV pilus assembly protein [Vicinamibacteria bacterium]
MRAFRTMSHRRSRTRSEKGASALELMMTMSIIFFLMLAVIQVSLISVTKLLTNYSAWMAARVWAVNEDDGVGKAQEAGTAILEIIDWGDIQPGFVDVQEGNEGAEVNYETSLGIPFLLKNNTAGRITTRGWGAVPRDPNGFSEAGDNRER